MLWRLVLVCFAATCGTVQAQSDSLKIRRMSHPGNGPLVMAQFRQIQTLPRDAEFGHVRRTWLRVMLGRHATAKGVFNACRYDCVRDRGPLLAEFRFPSSVAGKTITRTDSLQTRGWGIYFFAGPVRIPANAATGVAEVTLSFPKSPQVKPSILKFVVAPPEPPPFLQQNGRLATTDARYPGRKGSFFKRHPIEMQAGVTYTIDLKAAFDTYLFLEDEGGKILKQDDDSGSGQDARIIYRPTKTERCVIITTSYGSGATGGYLLSVRKTK